MFVQLCPRYLCVVLQASCFISSALLHVLMQRNTWWQKRYLMQIHQFPPRWTKGRTETTQKTHTSNTTGDIIINVCLFQEIYGMWETCGVSRWVVIAAEVCVCVCVCVSQRPERQTHLYLWSPTTWSHRDTHTSVILSVSFCLSVCVSFFLSFCLS